MLGARPITSIRSGDILEVLDGVVARGAPYQAHSLFASARRMFNWAIARGVYGLDRSPCDRMKPVDVIGPRAIRTRVLSDTEVRAVWFAAAELDYPFGPMVRLLLLTGQRRGEVANAEWSEFDFARKLWRIPAERMKADAPHVLPLTSEMIGIVTSLPRFGQKGRGNLVFSGTFGATGASGFSKMKRRLDELVLQNLRQEAAAGGDEPESINLRPWVLHDLRRTMRTGLSALPVPDLVRELVIAHRKPGLHKVYDQYAYLAEKKRALELWSAHVDTIVEPSRARPVQLPSTA